MTPGLWSGQQQERSCHLLSWADWESSGGGESSFGMHVEDARWAAQWRSQEGSWTHE